MTRSSTPAGVSLRRDWDTFVAVAALLLTVYALTLQPGVGGSGDSVKFQILGAHAGTPHATGYPAYLLINQAFVRLIPWGSAALLANLLSAILAALACAVLAVALRVAEVSRTVAIAAACGLGLSATLWSYATIAEVYALHWLCGTLILLFLLRWQRWQQTGDLLAAFAVLALAGGNHVTIACWLPAVIWFVLRVDPTGLARPRILVAGAAFVVVGSLQYGYLAWSTFDPDTRFLETTASDLAELAQVMSGGINKGFLWQQSVGEIFSQRLPWIGRSLLAELWLFAPLALVGLLRRPGRRDGLLLTAGACNLIFVMGYSVNDLEAYLPPIVMIGSCYAAFGMQRLLVLLGEQRHRLAWAALLLPVGLGWVNWHDADRRRGPDLQPAGEILDQAPDPSVVLSLGYPLSMRLSYAMLVDNAGGGRELLQVPAPAPFTSFGMEEIRRYLCQGRRFRLPPRGRLVTPGLPVLLTGATPEQLEALRARGFSAIDFSEDLVRLEVPACDPPSLPVAAVVPELLSSDGLDGAVALLTAADFDATRQAVVIGRPGNREIAGTAGVRVTEWADRRIVLEVESDQPGWLVVFDHLPGTWRAWIGDRPVASWPVNVIHRGLRVPAGRHQILLTEISGRFSLWRWLGGAHPPFEATPASGH